MNQRVNKGLYNYKSLKEIIELKMENYAFLKYSDYDKLYFTQLYDYCRQGGQVEGKRAVDFFKLSNVTPVSQKFGFQLYIDIDDPYSKS